MLLLPPVTAFFLHIVSAARPGTASIDTIDADISRNHSGAGRVPGPGAIVHGFDVNQHGGTPHFRQCSRNTYCRDVAARRRNSSSQLNWSKPC
jgi:hypothetical protein